MKVKIKKLHSDAVIPSYAMPGDAGMDLVAVSRYLDEFGNIVYGTGLAFEIPEGYVGLVFPRSSVSKKDLLLTNSVGVIDSGYRGEVTVKFKPSNVRFKVEDKDFSVFVPDNGNMCGEGDRVAQMIIMPYPQIEFEEVEELSKTDRAEGGYGSTGK